MKPKNTQLENMCDIFSKGKRSWWETLVQVLSREIYEISKNTFFAKHHRTTASDYSSIKSCEGRIGRRNLQFPEYSEMFKNSSFYRPPPVAASKLY